MPRVRIYQDASIDDQRLRKLLEAAGCAASEEEDQVDQPLGEGQSEAETVQEADENAYRAPDQEADVCEPDVLVVLLTRDLEDEVLENELRRATNCGSVIIGVWPEGESSGAIPPAFKKYSSDQVVWDAEAIRKAICGGGTEPAYQEPLGTPQPAPETPRHCC